MQLYFYNCRVDRARIYESDLHIELITNYHGGDDA